MLCHAERELCSSTVYECKPVDVSKVAFNTAITPIHFTSWDILDAGILPEEAEELTRQGLILVGNHRHHITHDVVNFLKGRLMGGSEAGLHSRDDSLLQVLLFTRKRDWHSCNTTKHETLLGGQCSMKGQIKQIKAFTAAWK